MLDINRENLSQESLCSGFVNKQKSYLQRTYGILDSAPKLTVIPDSKRELGASSYLSLKQFITLKINVQISKYTCKFTYAFISYMQCCR